MVKDLIIDEELCIGCGTCSDLCPDVFELNETIEKAYVKNQQACSQCDCEEAINSCPVGAIFWKEE